MCVSSAVVLCSLATIGCDNKDSEMHSVYIVYPNISQNYLSQGLQPVFADQTEDTLSFSTTEAWELVSSADDWLHVPEGIKKYTNVKSNSIYSVSDLVNFEINNTGRKRWGYITVNAGEYSVSVGYLQLPYLNIHRPMRIVTGSDLATSVRDTLVTICDSCNVERDSITFTTYKKWTLTAKDGQWLAAGKTNGNEGYNKVYLSFTPNSTNKDRTDTLFLTSGGVVDAIAVKQYAKE